MRILSQGYDAQTKRNLDDETARIDKERLDKACEHDPLLRYVAKEQIKYHLRDVREIIVTQPCPCCGAPKTYVQKDYQELLEVNKNYYRGYCSKVSCSDCQAEWISDYYDIGLWNNPPRKPSYWLCVFLVPLLICLVISAYMLKWELFTLFIVLTTVCGLNIGACISAEQSEYIRPIVLSEEEAQEITDNIAKTEEIRSQK